MIKKASINDIEVAHKIIKELWNNVEKDEIKNLIRSSDNAIYLYYVEKNLVGFAQCGLRNDYVEGTSFSPVGYLEGIYIREKYRLKGYANELVNVCEKWIKEKGCKEFASDCELSNKESEIFHKKIGFSEVNRIICFNKKIT